MSSKNIIAAACISAMVGLSHLCSLTYADLGPISLRFCNNPDELTKQLNLSLGTDQPGSICMQFMNDSEKAKFIDVGFVDGITTNDQEQNKACKNDGENEQFGKYVSSDTPNPIRIPAGGSIKVIGSIKYPKNMPGGEMLGCVVYSDVESNANATQQGNAFAIKVRKASFVNVSLSGEILLGLSFVDISKQPSLFASLTDSPFIRGYDSRQRKDLLQANIAVQVNKAKEPGIVLEYSLYNSGSVSEQVSIQTSVTDFFGKTQKLPISQRTINANQTTLFREAIPELSRYKGLFKVKVSVSHKPLISTTIDTQGKFKGGIITQETSFFLIPWLPIVLVLLALSMIALLIAIYQKSRQTYTSPTRKSYAKVKAFVASKRSASHQQEQKTIQKILKKADTKQLTSANTSSKNITKAGLKSSSKVPPKPTSKLSSKVSSKPGNTSMNKSSTKLSSQSPSAQSPTPSFKTSKIGSDTKATASKKATPIKKITEKESIKKTKTKPIANKTPKSQVSTKQVSTKQITKKPVSTKQAMKTKTTKKK